MQPPSTHEMLHPLAISTLADLIHHVRQRPHAETAQQDSVHVWKEYI